jgi:glycosyltransferase involved in cell wall biosynthesis
VIWAAITLDPPVSGEKVNEVERVKVLSKKFIVYAFSLVSLRNFGKRRTYVMEWFKDARMVTVLPWLNVYGVRLLSRFAAGIIVALTVVLLKLGRGVDLVISRGSVASLPLVLVCRLIGVRVLYNVLSVPFEHTEMAVLSLGMLTQTASTARLMKLVDYFVLREADRIGVANEAAAEELATTFGNGFRQRIVFLRFPVADDYFDNYAVETLQAKRAISLLYCGSISGLYDFSQLIKALREMSIRDQAVSLTIYTSRASRASLTRFASNASFLTLKDQVPKEELIRALRQCTAVVIPSSSAVKTVVPIKAIEAMALGVPVIVANPRDLKIFRDGETCLVVSDNTPKAWQEAMMRAIVPEYREKIIRGARVQAESFRCSQNLEIISELLNRLGGQNRVSRVRS